METLDLEPEWATCVEGRGVPVFSSLIVDAIGILRERVCLPDEAASADMNGPKLGM